MMVAGVKRPGEPGGPPVKKGKGASGEGVATAEVRMSNADEAAMAVQNLDGSMLGGGAIGVAADGRSKDGTKLTVTGIVDGIKWEEVKEHFMQVGEVKFAAVNKLNYIGSDSTVEAEVRFETAEALQNALTSIDGSDFAGTKISIRVDQTSKDGTKCYVGGIPLGTAWQDVKDHCSQAGTVAYCAIKSPGGADMAEGEIRFDDPELAQQALSLDGTIVCGAMIKVQIDSIRADKLRVYGLPPHCQWQELKDHFATIGTVAFSNVKRPQNDAWAGGAEVGTGEVRFDDPGATQLAVDQLTGSILGGAAITVRIDPVSKDGSKVIVTGIPPGVSWEMLKDHCSSVGHVAYANIKGGGFDKGGFGKGGKGGGGGFGWPGGGMDPWSAMMQMGGMKGMMMMMKGKMMKGMMKGGGKGKGW